MRRATRRMGCDAAVPSGAWGRGLHALHRLRPTPCKVMGAYSKAKRRASRLRIGTRTCTRGALHAHTCIAYHSMAHTTTWVVHARSLATGCSRGGARPLR